MVYGIKCIRSYHFAETPFEGGRGAGSPPGIGGFERKELKRSTRETKVLLLLDPPG